MRKVADALNGPFILARHTVARGSERPEPDDGKGEEVVVMDKAIGLETEAAAEPVSNEPDTGADVQQDGEFQGEY